MKGYQDKGYQDEGYLGWGAIVKLSLVLGFFAAIVGGMLWLNKNVAFTGVLAKWAAFFLFIVCPAILFLLLYVRQVFKDEKGRRS